jgi:hypothetical protein
LGKRPISNEGSGRVNAIRRRVDHGALSAMTNSPEPGTREPTWQDQWRRIERWMLRLHSAEAGDLSYIGQKWCDSNVGVQLYKDDVVAYFQACYHFKDWLKKDPASAKSAANVEEFINGTDCFKVAADVTNRSKHGLADRAPRLDENAQPRSHRMVIYGADGQFEMVGGEAIPVNGDFIPALVVAEECFARWQAYLKERGLL